MGKAKEPLLEELKSDKKFSIPTIEEDGFHVEEDTWYLLVRNLKKNINTMLVGATGCGKTELTMLAAKKLGRACNVYDMGSMYDPISGLLGVHRLNDKGTSVFDYAKFTQDIQEPGIIVLDEFSRAPIMSNNILFPCLDSRRELPVEIAGGRDMRRIKVHPDCVFVATANVGSEYTGTNMLDRALVNRFFTIELHYMSEADEARVLCQRTGVAGDAAFTIVMVANKIRNLYAKQELSDTVSTRETLMASELVVDGYDIVKAVELVFLPLFEGTNTEGERSIVRKLFASF